MSMSRSFKKKIVIWYIPWKWSWSLSQGLAWGSRSFSTSSWGIRLSWSSSARRSRRRPWRGLGSAGAGVSACSARAPSCPATRWRGGPGAPWCSRRSWSSPGRRSAWSRAPTTPAEFSVVRITVSFAIAAPRSTRSSLAVLNAWRHGGERVCQFNHGTWICRLLAWIFTMLNIIAWRLHVKTEFLHVATGRQGFGS